MAVPRLLRSDTSTVILGHTASFTLMAAHRFPTPMDLIRDSGRNPPRSARGLVLEPAGDCRNLNVSEEQSGACRASAYPKRRNKCESGPSACWALFPSAWQGALRTRR